MLTMCRVSLKLSGLHLKKKFSSLRIYLQFSHNEIVVLVAVSGKIKHQIYIIINKELVFSRLLVYKL